MDLKIIAGIIVFSIIAIVVGILIPVDDVIQKQTLPWQVERTAQGLTRVFGVTPGKSTLQQAEQQLNSEAEISLFATLEEEYVVEAYFDKVILGGLSAKMIMVAGLSRQQLESMYARGTRISTLGSGVRKVALQYQDIIVVRNTPIINITYLPYTRLDEPLIRKRFGEPQKKLKETETEMTHWLYPDLGLDIALNKKGKAVFQYTSPELFSTLSLPLTQRTTSEN